ncbi:endonuclease V [Granulosicoccus antarcticus]|uniref:Endonuclease V n=1 Tax=Granulosicoccus antarcticus IMCC3135 TaxID=1192854 RepID=A0A2Z2NQH9_9GAMM|nr:endonuclease V [Granulosicoccus antarcticus]ASJ72241.1 Endonuclease V [Granulosicoccus antarcticus IMCC3135]
MLLAIDVQYDDTNDRAGIAAVLFDNWQSSSFEQCLTNTHTELEPYEPGFFYRRELPCLMPVLKRACQRHSVDTIIIDGFVDLGSDKPGLGRYVFAALDEAIPIIGVAKNPFTESGALPVTRGNSNKSLWISSTHDVQLAAQRVSSMHGQYRFPTLLKEVDSQARAVLGSPVATA